jgi:ubiquinone/menaquinone biosynthesis C-methylase UbiE
MKLHLSEHWRHNLECPTCKAPLDQVRDQTLVCLCCQGRYPISKGIVKFRAPDEDGSQPAFTTVGQDFHENLVGRFGLYMARRHYLYRISNHVKPGGRLIEIGSGGGSRYLGRRYDTLGVDLSLSAAQVCSSSCKSAIQSGASPLPLASNSADGIVSSCLLEHLDDTTVRPVLSEMCRVLASGAVMVHFFDLDTDHGFFSWAKRQDWYGRIFVKSRGHFGLRPWNEWENLFAECGFRIQAAQFFCKWWIQDASTWAALRDDEVPPLAKSVARVVGSARSSRMLSLGVDCITTFTDDTIGRLMPDRWSSKAIVILQKSTR